MSGKGLKRERDINTSLEEDEVTTFTKTKRVIRSPTSQYREKTEDMDEVKDMLREMMKTIQQNTEENKELREEIRRNQKMWDKEKRKLEGRIDILEGRLEAMDKEKRKCNVIIKGLTDEQVDETEINNFLETNVNVKIQVKKISHISKQKEGNIVLVEMNTWDEKQAIMKNKFRLKGTKVYVEHDLTLEERRIEAEIRRIAREERKKGKQVKIGYKKVIINGEIYEWSKQDDGVVQQKERTKN